MKRINLLPKTQQQEVRLQLFANRFILFWLGILISLAIFLIALVAGRVYLTGKSEEVSTSAAAKQQLLQSSDNESLTRQIRQLNDQIDNFKTLNANHYYWSKALIELGNLLPPDVAVDLLTLERTTGQVDIKATAGTRDSMLTFWSRLHKSDYFKNINFPLSNLNLPVNDPFTFQFEIKPEVIKK